MEPMPTRPAAADPPAPPRRRRIVAAAAAALALLLAAAVYLLLFRADVPPAPGPLGRGWMDFGDVERAYLIHRPAALPERPPLLIVLHGTPGGPERIRALTGYAFERLADERGFVVLYPEAYRGHWNDCRAGARSAAKRHGIDDVRTIRILIRHLRARHGVGDVFVVGYAGGGHMAYRLALEAPGDLAGVAAIAASLPDAGGMDCAPRAEPVPVLVVAGTGDRFSPYHGGTGPLPGGRGRGAVRPAAETARYFAGLAGEAGDAAAQRVGTSERVAERRRWPGPVPVELLTVHGGGHTIPSPDVRFPRYLGRTERRLDAPAEIWRFFEGLRRPAPLHDAAEAT
jgi:polyhydroxybutyrate depolymerase